MALDPDRLDWLRRNSRVTLDREGRFFFQGRLVEHPRVRRLFHQGLRQTDDGLVLQVGEQWCFVESVEDAAWFVEKAAVEYGRVLLSLADGAVEPLDADSLTRRGDSDLYCTLSGGRRARFLRDAVVALSPWIDEENGTFGLRLADGFHRMRAE